MRASVARFIAALCCLAIFGCRARPASPLPLEAAVDGTIAVDGLSAVVRIVRDKWGVPHLYAERQDDLFFAQGFVQAEDRLFQMDLWRRSVQGRLAEVLGSNFVARDTMTRRMQYRGDLDAEWASYGADAKATATAFVRGINAWVAVARERPPEEFVLAGWLPDYWRPDDLLNRTDAFVASGDALSEVFRTRLVASLGVARAQALLPGASLAMAGGLDPSLVNFAVADALRGVGATPFFTSLAAPVAKSEKGDGDLFAVGTNFAPRKMIPVPFFGSNAWVVSGDRSATGAPLLAVDPHRPLTNPSLRYLVHLVAPGWNVVGATVPWLPGVVIGHNDRVAWGMTSHDADTEDIFVERLNPADRHQVDDRGRWTNTAVITEHVWVKGRPQPVAFDREYTPHGIVVAVDGEKHLAFTVRWSGQEPGAAGELAATTLDRATSASEFRAALARWKMPAVEMVYADRDGNLGSQVAALVPARRGWSGAVPAPGWTGSFDWNGWRTLEELPHTTNPRTDRIVSANNNAARTERLREAFAATRVFTIDDFEALQHDVVAWNAKQLVPLLGRVPSDRPDVEEARQQLQRWDRRMAVDAAPARLYDRWEGRLRRMLVERRVDRSLADEFIAREGNHFVPAIMKPSRAWFDGDVVKARDMLLVAALSMAVDDLKKSPDFRQVTFAHPLAVTEQARRRFDVGPFAMAGYPDTVMSMSGRQPASGAALRAIFDLDDWDRSVVENAPGQSGSPTSKHFRDLAAGWAAGEYFPLVFSDAAVRANAESTLTLVPR